MATCYILFSPSTNRFYIGATNELIELRIQKHNSKAYSNKAFTAFVSDWCLFLKFDCICFQQAIAIEKHIKKMKSKVFINNLKLHEELRMSLLERYAEKCF